MEVVETKQYLYRCTHCGSKVVAASKLEPRYYDCPMCGEQFDAGEGEMDHTLGVDNIDEFWKRKTEEVEEGKKYDSEKRMYHLLLPEFEKEMADVITFGAKKYGEENWKKVDNPQNRYYSALRRHLELYHEEFEDEETKASHLAHVAINAMFLYYFEREEMEIYDDLSVAEYELLEDRIEQLEKENGNG